MNLIATNKKFKKTGLDWMPEIPEHWEVRRLCTLFEERKEIVSENDYAPLSVTMNGIVPQLNNAAKTIHVDNRKKVCVGDFVINSRSDRRGSGGISSLEGAVSIINIVLKPSNFYIPKYTHYLLTNKLFQDEFYFKGKGIVADMWTTSFTELKTIYLPVPPLSEQEQIVQYIQSKEEKINRFIEKKQQLIELLKEKRQSIINESITKRGREWKTYRLKTIVSSYTNGVWGYEPKGNDEDIYCIRVADIDNLNYGISEKNLTVRNIEISEQEGRLLKNGDLIIEKSGGGDLSPVGRVVIYNLPYKAVTSNFMARLNISMEINNEFLYFIFSYLYSERRNVPSIKATTGIQNLDLYSYLQNKVSIPPLEEQKQIVDYIKKETAIIDKAIAKAEREIELMKEYKEAMIAEAVMGTKI